jgi:glycosyltransferase involved in cell wall biosynthesis
MHRENLLPLVTIVIPSYNQAEFLEHTLHSVFRQDYGSIEFLVVDGASTDGSDEIIKSHATKLKWWVSESDSGQAEAINKGLQRAKGEIIAWLNSDDLLLPGAVSHAVEVMQANPNLGMVYGDAITIDGIGNPLNRLSFPDWTLIDLMAFRVICQPAVFIRRAVLEQVGFVDESYHYMLDHQLWLRIGRVAPIQHISSYMAAARHHPLAKNVLQAEHFAREISQLLDWIENQPDLSMIFHDNRKKVIGGACRLKARYLLDGGEFKQSLKAYIKAFQLQPSYTLRHSHRIIYAFISLMGGKSLGEKYYQIKRRKQLDLPILYDLVGWPGLMIDG